MVGVIFMLGVVIACAGAFMWRKYSQSRTPANLAVAGGMTALAFGLIGWTAFVAQLA